LTHYRYHTPSTIGATNEYFAPDQEAMPGSYRAGDFILTHGNSVFSYLIRFGQRLRFRGANRPFAWWSHAALVVSPAGNLIEALGAGVLRTHISRYAPTEYVLVRLGKLADPGDRAQVLAYANWAVAQRYGWLTIVSIAISLVLGGKFTFGYDGQSICSGLVARALERTNAVFDRSPSHIMPADLARYFNVPAPIPGSRRGVIPGRGPDKNHRDVEPALRGAASTGRVSATDDPSEP
jgi:hypothetical protein